MPLYDFQCCKCDHVFEEQCKVDDRKKTKCPKCHSKKVEQIFTKPFPKHLSWGLWKVGENNNG